MKFNPITTVIAVAISGLISYAFYAFNLAYPNEIISMVIISFIFFSITLIGSIGIFFDYSRTTTVIRTLSVTFFLIGLALLILLGSFKIGISVVIISIGITFLLYILIAYSIAKSKH